MAVNELSIRTSKGNLKEDSRELSQTHFLSEDASEDPTANMQTLNTYKMACFSKETAPRVALSMNNTVIENKRGNSMQYKLVYRGKSILRAFESASQRGGKRILVPRIGDFQASADFHLRFLHAREEITPGRSCLLLPRESS